jgi:hypothetical protein
MTPEERKRGLRAAVQAKVDAARLKAMEFHAGRTFSTLAYRIALLWEIVDSLVDEADKAGGHIAEILTHQLYSSIADLAYAAPRNLLGFAAQIANMTAEEEMADGMPSEDAVETVNSLIAEARKLTGIDPGHPKIWCQTCGTPTNECECQKQPQALVCIDCMNGQHEVSGHPDCTCACHGNGGKS